jgi:hypothetical protein
LEITASVVTLFALADNFTWYKPFFVAS